MSKPDGCSEPKHVKYYEDRKLIEDRFKQNHPGINAEYGKRWRESPEGKIWLLEHREERNKYSRDWHLENRDEANKKMNDYYYANISYFAEYSKEWRRNNESEHRQSQYKYRQSCKKQVIDKLGGKCVICCESRLDFLTLGHPANNGVTHRKEIGMGNTSYVFLVVNNFPEEHMKQLQVECWTCNCSKQRAFWDLDEKLITAAQKYWKKSYIKAFTVLGNKCAHCGDSNLKHLTFGHPMGNGRKHRKLLGNNPQLKIARMVIGELPSDGFELNLECWNCNCSRLYE